MADNLKCVVVTPEATALERDADFVAVPLYDGELGIAPGHSPLIGRLGYGEMRIRYGGKTMHYYIDGGFVQVADNVVSILTNRAVPAQQVNTAAAEAQLVAAAQQPVSNAELLAVRDKTVAQARAQLRVARRSGM